MARLILIATLIAFAIAFDFTLRYEGHCVKKSNQACSLKATSMDIKTRIEATGGVHEEHRKLVGAVSNFIAEGKYDPTKNLETLAGNMSFGTHTTQKDHLLHFTGAGAWIYQSPRGDRILDGGYLKITGGDGAFKGHKGAASFVCEAAPQDKDRVACWITGNVLKD